MARFWLVPTLLGFACLAPTASAVEDGWIPLVEDQEGLQDLSSGGRADIKTILLNPGDGHLFQVALESPPRTPKSVNDPPQNDPGEFLFSVYFELSPLFDEPSGDVRAGPSTQVRLNSLVTSSPSGDDATFRLAFGDVHSTFSPLDEREIVGTVDADRVVWSIDRSRDFAGRGANLPADRPWRLSGVFAEARPLVAGPLVDGVLDSTGPGYEPYDDLRTDRAPDSSYGRSATISSESPADGGERATRVGLVKFAGASEPHAAAVATSVMAGFLVLAWLGYWIRFWRGLNPAGVVGLFTRIVRSQALDNDRRRLVYDAVHANPGITFGNLRSLTEIGSGPLAHHLKILEHHALLVARRALGRKYYYVADGTSRNATFPPSDDVLALLERSPPMTPTDVAAALGQPRSTIAARLRFWERIGRLKSERIGRLRRYQRA